jgi:DNA-binding IclR family transcriptional regulator
MKHSATKPTKPSRRALAKNAPSRNADAQRPRYRAPALEKGLDVLELLAAASSGLSQAEIVSRLGRSTSELFRMIQVLNERRFIEQSPDRSGYRLTGKLMALGLDRPPISTVSEVALPFMRRLAMTIGQSCHLAVAFNGDITVVARVESSAQIGFTVRVGYSQPLHDTASGAVLFAFQPQDVRTQWEQLLHPAPTQRELAAWRRRADEIHVRGFEEATSPFVDGITDLSAPIVREDVAVAALTVPFVQSKLLVTRRAESMRHLQATARDISEELRQLGVD